VVDEAALLGAAEDHPAEARAWREEIDRALQRLRADQREAFLLKYVEDKILPSNPFQTLDDAVAGLMGIAVAKGRSTKPNLELGICGEHGGDPESIFKCEKLGLDYVSCSPFRVPVARLAAAQAALVNASERDK